MKYYNVYTPNEVIDFCNKVGNDNVISVAFVEHRGWYIYYKENTFK